MTKKRRLRKIVPWGTIDFTNGLFDFAGIEAKECIHIEDVVIEEDDMKTNCNLEDPLDKLFMRWILEEIFFYQPWFSCD